MPLQHLRSLNNFSTLMAFVAGFNNAAVSRLKFTRAELSSKALKRLEELEQTMSAEASYKAYRNEIHSCQPPLVPYMCAPGSLALSFSLSDCLRF